MLNITSKQFGTVTILEVAGRLDSMSAQQLLRNLQPHLEAPDSHLLLDFGAVNYLSAAGLRVLRTIQAELGYVRIVQPSQRVREVMQITGLDAVYQLFDTTIAALHLTQPTTNAHTHLELGWLRDGLPPITGMDFAQWISQRVGQRVSQHSSDDMLRLARQAAEAGVQQLVEAGISIVGDISATGQSLAALNNARMNGIVYIELIGRRDEQVDSQLQNVREFIEAWRPKLHSGLQLGLTPHTPYTVHPELWRKGLQYAREAELPLCVHVAESPAEIQYMHDGTGSIREYIYPDLPALEPQGLTPVQYLEAIGALEQQPLLVHGVQVSNADIALIKQYGCSVVHCPRSNIRLQCGRMPLEKYLAQDIPVLMGTDSLVSSPSLNVMDEVEFAVALHHGKVESETILSLVHRVMPTR